MNSGAARRTAATASGLRVVLLLGVGPAFHKRLTALGAGLGTLKLHGEEGEEEVAGATRGEPLTVTGPAE